MCVLCLSLEILNKLFMQSVWPLHQVCIVVSFSSSSMKMSVCFVVMFMMRESCQQVRVVGLTSENSGKLNWRIEWKNFMFRCVKYDLTVQMCSVSHIIPIVRLCKGVPVTIVLKCLFLNFCSFISVKMNNSLYKGDLYTNEGGITVL
jgi:ABC-type microcin C transport system permease subunit YejB